MSVSEPKDGRGAGRLPVRWSVLFGHLVRVRIGLHFQGTLILLFPGRGCQHLIGRRPCLIEPATPVYFRFLSEASPAERTKPILHSPALERSDSDFFSVEFTALFGCLHSIESFQEGSIVADENILVLIAFYS